VKPTSIISMVVAVLLIIAGFVTCLIAENMAESEGKMLFAENREDGLVNTVDLSDTAVSKLEINVSDAQIHIYGGSESSYIELINFRENYYSLNASNRVVSFDEVPDVTSMLKFWENGMSFKGIRYLLTFDKSDEPEGDKIINVYLGGENIDLKILNITGNICDVYLEKLDYSTDYAVTLTDGNFTMTSCKNASSLTLNGTDIRANMKETIVSTFNIACSKFTLDAYRMMSPTTVIDCEVADIDLTPTQSLGSINYDITLDSGSITVAGSNVGNSYVQTASSTNSFQLIATSGEVILNNPPTQAEITGGAAWPPASN